jgi:hypothetical protein
MYRSSFWPPGVSFAQVANFALTSGQHVEDGAVSV